MHRAAWPRVGARIWPLVAPPGSGSVTHLLPTPKNRRACGSQSKVVFEHLWIELGSLTKITLLRILPLVLGSFC